MGTINSRRGRKRSFGALVGQPPLSDAEKTPEAFFKRVAGVRTAKVLKLCRGLEVCSNPAVYKYSKDQVAAMLAALRKAVGRVERAFLQPSKTTFAEGHRDREEKGEYWWDEGPRRRRAPQVPVHDNRTARQKYLDRNKQGRRFSQRRLGVGPR